MEDRLVQRSFALEIRENGLDMYSSGRSVARTHEQVC